MLVSELVSELVSLNLNLTVSTVGEQAPRLAVVMNQVPCHTSHVNVIYYVHFI